LLCNAYSGRCRPSAGFLAPPGPAAVRTAALSTRGRYVRVSERENGPGVNPGIAGRNGPVCFDMLRQSERGRLMLTSRLRKGRRWEAHGFHGRGVRFPRRFYVALIRVSTSGNHNKNRDPSVRRERPRSRWPTRIVVDKATAGGRARLDNLIPSILTLYCRPISRTRRAASACQTYSRPRIFRRWAQWGRGMGIITETCKIHCDKLR
jgi:hypothetical protein